MKKTLYPKLGSLFIILATATFVCASPTNNSAPTLSELRNASYTGIEDKLITLSNGNWEGEPYMQGAAARPRVGLLEDIYFTGDLNGDGAPETVVILWQSAAGTGSYSYLAVFARIDNKVKNIGTALIGDRVKLRSGAIAKNELTLEVLQVADKDPMCCPTQLATRKWSFGSGQLEEAGIEVTGKLSLLVLTNTEWHLTQFDWDKPVDEDIGVTLAFTNDRVAGKSACNRYSAEIAEGDNPGSIKIGQSMSTMMACPDPLMKIERQYLSALSKTTRFSFHAAKLLLNGQADDGTPFSLMFTQKKDGEP